ncbi:hypothetical protein Aperf_G00000115407 [Anoplocephala perfoliata]
MSFRPLYEQLLLNFNSRIVLQPQLASRFSQIAKSLDSTCTAMPFQNDREEMHLMRKYKRKLQNILCSGDVNEKLSLVKITHLANSSEGRTLTVFWAPDEIVTNEMFTQKIDALLQASSKIIKEKLERGNAYRKLPRLEFVRSSPDAQFGQFEDQSDCQSCKIIKPDSVYGLMWSEYADRIRAKPRGDAVMVNCGDENFSDDIGSISHKTSTTKWAKMWREQNNAKLIAKRERKRSHQMLGLWNLEKEMEELG